MTPAEWVGITAVALRGQSTECSLYFGTGAVCHDGSGVTQLQNRGAEGSPSGLPAWGGGSDRVQVAQPLDRKMTGFHIA
jgi:hypothetical protein